ncbi:MAG: type I-MYXAN CRISPR-associated protein Cas6/Cmx6 [Gammaproteobacteria bacterium]
MYWEEDKQAEKTHVTDDVVDLVFSIHCKSLPVDHVYALSESVHNILPWLRDEEFAGIHSIHVAASGNGWMRPEVPGELLHLSRRTKFELRVPEHRVEDARLLEGTTLNVAGHPIEIQTATVRQLSTITILLCRYLATDEDTVDEKQVLAWVAGQLKNLGIAPRKILFGIENFIQSPAGPIRTRSLMLADLEVDESLILQRKGLGPHRHLGCGLFIPHKHINDLRAEQD